MRGGPPWMGPGRYGPGRRFRRGAFVALAFVVLLVAALATVVGSILSGNAPAPWITVAVSAVVVVGLVASARVLWRSARSIGVLMDAADRVAGGDYTTRVGEVPSRALGRLTAAFDEMTERLESNERRRRDLLADVAHELRNPLQVIRGSLEGMLDGLYPVEEERLRPLLDETEVMSRLLEDLRTLSMAEAGVLRLELETVDPRRIAEDAVDAYRSAAADADVRLELVVEESAPDAMDADPVRLSEVLANLLTNAIRHSPGGTSVAVRIRGADPGVVFEVDDDGPGIPSDQIPFVFDRFVASADSGGTGLGLAIAKRLVEAHGGTIEALTPSGGGTHMRVRIPSGRP
jgi:two-component system sensor histidine kinase BaeS